MFGSKTFIISGWGSVQPKGASGACSQCTRTTTNWALSSKSIAPDSKDTIAATLRDTPDRDATVVVSGAVARRERPASACRMVGPKRERR